MSDAACDAEPRQEPYSPLHKAIFSALNNRLVETLIVAGIAVGALAVTVVDGLLGTRLAQQLIAGLRDASRDRLSPLRSAQIRHVFRCRYGLRKIRLRLAGGSYWLSIPCIVEGVRDGEEVRYMAKIINETSALKHRYMTMLRNLGVLASASDLRFDEHMDAEDMVNFERYCLTQIRGQDLKAPAVIGVHRLNPDDYMLVTEYIAGQPLSEVSITGDGIDQVLDIVKTMHEHRLVHGDVKLDNFMFSRGRVFVLDCLKMGGSALRAAESFDLMCALCALSQKAPVAMVIAHARERFSPEELRKAAEFLDIAVSKADIDLPQEKVRELRRALGGQG